MTRQEQTPNNLTEFPEPWITRERLE